MTPRDKTHLKAALGVVAAVAGATVAVMSALQMQGRVRTVDILTLFAGGVGAGVGLVGAIVEIRRSRDREQPPPSATETARTQKETPDEILVAEGHATGDAGAAGEADI